ncbi:MAG: hypothetical protein PHE51_06740 [Eubacteriales bacterium]|nr:hypothetical protein [Eubacteriales bacterium]
MIIMGVITGDKRLFHPFEIFEVDSKVQLILCYSLSEKRLKKIMEKHQVCGYISLLQLKLPFNCYSYQDIFHIKAPDIVKKYYKNNKSVMIICCGDMDKDFYVMESLADRFSEIYITHTKEEYIKELSGKAMCDLGIAVEVNPSICDVEINFGYGSCGYGKISVSYDTQYQLNANWDLPSVVDNRSFAAAMLRHNIISEKELEGMTLSLERG